MTMFLRMIEVEGATDVITSYSIHYTKLYEGVMPSSSSVSQSQSQDSVYSEMPWAKKEIAKLSKKWQPRQYTSIKNRIRTAFESMISVITSYSIHYTKLYDLSLFEREYNGYYKTAAREEGRKLRKTFLTPKPMVRDPNSGTVMEAKLVKPLACQRVGPGEEHRKIHENSKDTNALRKRPDLVTLNAEGWAYWKNRNNFV